MVEVTNTYDIGWMNPAGYYLTVDMGAIKFETSQVWEFEIHRPLNQSSSEPVVFDATGVFGVSECSIALDSYSFITEGRSDFFDRSPVTYGSLPNAVGASMEWTVENLEGTLFNSYACQVASMISNWGFSLYGRSSEADDYTSKIALTGHNVDMLRRKSWDVPVGLIGFRHFKYVTDVPAAMDFEFSSNFFQYCRSSGATCPGIEEYPSVSEGQISPASCEAGFRGYAYRVCENGVLRDVKTDMCEYKVPDNLAYAESEYTFVQGLEASTGLPTYDNIVLEFEVNPSTPLPEGL